MFTRISVRQVLILLVAGMAIFYIAQYLCLTLPQQIYILFLANTGTNGNKVSQLQGGESRYEKFLW